MITDVSIRVLVHGWSTAVHERSIRGRSPTVDAGLSDGGHYVALPGCDTLANHGSRGLALGSRKNGETRGSAGYRAKENPSVGIRRPDGA